MFRIFGLVNAAAVGSCLVLFAAQAYAVSCWQNLPSTNPNEIYIDNGDGTITDTRTGLMWRECIEGRSGGVCEIGSIIVQRFSWGEALDAAEVSDFAGYTDWRVPNVKEVATLVEECRPGPTINNSVFPNTPATGYWTSSPSGAGLATGGAWYVSFNDGGVGTINRGIEHAVRLVRGGQ